MNCIQCGGLIMEIGKVYGYAGKICYCPKQVRPINPFTGDFADAWKQQPECEVTITEPKENEK